HKRNREPVTHRLAQASLVFYVVGQMAKGVTLGLAPLIGDFLIAAGERYRLEAQEADGLGVIERELDDAAHLFIVDAVHDGGNRNNLHSCFVQVVDGAQLYIKQIADLTMGIGGITNSVKLQ